MIDRNRAQKVGVRIGAILAIINAVPLAIVLFLLGDRLFPETLIEGFKPIYQMMLIGSFIRIIAGAFISALIFSYIYSAAYNKLPGSTSLKKGISLGFIYWIIFSVIIGSFLTLRYDEIYYIITVLDGIIAALFFGLLISYFWDKYSESKEVIKKDKRTRIIVIFVILFMITNGLTYYNFFDTMLGNPVEEDDPGKNDFLSGENITKGDGYIQQLIDQASEGDTIIIPSGTYYENIIIDKSIKLFGENKETTIIDGNGQRNCVFINADNVIINKFTIQNCGEWTYDAGIKIYSDNNNISDNNIINNKDGIFLVNCKNNDIFSNNISNNTRWGIIFNKSPSNNKISNNQILNGMLISGENNHFISNYIKEGFSLSGDNNLLSSNHIFGSNSNGIDMTYSTNCTIILNDIYNNSWDGIDVTSHSNNNNISKNHIYQNRNGISLGVAHTNHINSNYIFNNSQSGFEVHSSPDNSIISNSITNNSQYGIYLKFESDNNIIKNNIIKNNYNYGIFIEKLRHFTEYPSDNIIYNNYFENINNSADNTSENQWYTTKTLDVNIVNGLYIGGNYWSDYSGIDGDEDLIGDTPYLISGGGNNQDIYPLINSADI